MMKLHYIDEYKVPDIPYIIYQIIERRVCDDIKEMITDKSWNAILIETIDDAIISDLDLNETINLEDVFRGEDLVNLRKEVIDRLKYMFK